LVTAKYRSLKDTLEIRATVNDAAPTAGMLAARAWLASRGLSPPAVKGWHVDILLDVADQVARPYFDDRVDTRFRIEIWSEEWSYMFCHSGQMSRVRVTHVPMIDGRDEFVLLHSTPALRDMGELLRAVERRHKIAFRRHGALVRTNLPAAETSIRRWVDGL